LAILRRRDVRAGAWRTEGSATGGCGNDQIRAELHPAKTPKNAETTRQMAARHGRTYNGRAMAEPARRRATYADVLAAPPDQVAEILDGELYLQPRPAAPHAAATSVLGMDIGSTFQRGRGGPGGWWILDEPELHLGPEPDVVVPDLAGWRLSRMPELTSTAYFTLAPDWVCEVLSDSTRRVDRVKKMPIYGREQVPHVWLVDPIAQTVEVFRLDGATYRLVAAHAGDETPRLEPFEAVELDLMAVWAKRV
jgi:Uma2 family endonuclease